MEMDTVVAQFRDLCNNPVAWVILAAASLRAAHSIIMYVKCPYVGRVDRVSADEARAMLESRTLHNPRFIAGMSAALALTIGGLYAAQTPEFATGALAAIVVGVFLLLVAPSQLTIADGTLRVAAARLHGGETLSFAADRLRRAHLERILIEVGFALAFGSLVLTF